MIFKLIKLITIKENSKKMFRQGDVEVSEVLEVNFPAHR